MGFTVIPLILAISIVFQCYGVNSEKIVVSILHTSTKMRFGYKPIANGGYIIQKVTPNVSFVGQLHYDQVNRELLYVSKQKDGSVYAWQQSEGTTRQQFYKELKNETLATVTSIIKKPRQFLIGSDLNLRVCLQNKTDYTLSKPVLRFNDTGFIIYAAHCDTNGKMLILLIGVTAENENLGKLYKIENQKAKLIKEFSTKPRDFQFNFNYTLVYMVHKHGKIITEYKYDQKTARLGNERDVFNKDEYPNLMGHTLKSVAVDRDPGHLWVAAAGNDGYVLEVNPSEKTLISITIIPSKYLTFATYGYTTYKHLFVGSRETCVKGNAQGAIYSISGTGRQGVPDKPVKW